MKEFGGFLGFGRRSEIAAAAQPIEQSPASSTSTIILRPTVFADMANALWGLRQKSADNTTGEFKDEFRSVARYIDRLSECLEEIGVEVQSHTNQVFDSGQSLEVIAFQPTAGISREIVTETIRPTIYLKKHRLQIGQVIVATPEHSGEDNQ